MARIKIFEARKACWRAASEFPSRETAEFLSPAEADSLVNVHFAGGEATPQLVEVRLAPGADINLHAHDHDEIMYIVAGSMHVGNKVLDPGSSLFIAGGTYYQFKAGPEGLQFLNFRPCRDFSYIPPPS